MENKSYKNKAKDIIIKALTEEAQKKRLEKRKIDNRLGCFVQIQTQTQTKRRFVEG